MTTPHKLDLYRLAVQDPAAEVAFVHKVFAHYRMGAIATRLREDFAGTSVVATAWVAEHPGHQALAVDTHAATLRWAWRRAEKELGPRAADLHLVHGDVMGVTTPKVDAVLALNFSAFIFHHRDELRDYFRVARRVLVSGGVLILDAYGGPGAMRPGTQRRRVEPPPHERVAPFEYQWEQRSYDAATARVDCRIHFRVKGRLLRSVFRYDWRLWTLPELIGLLREAGFAKADIWCEGDERPGVYRPVKRMPNRSEWVAYVVGVR